MVKGRSPSPTRMHQRWQRLVWAGERGGMMKGCVRETLVRTRQETRAFPAGHLCKTGHLGCSSSAPPANPWRFPLSCGHPAEPRHISAAVRGRACPPPPVPGSLVLPSLVPCPCPLSQPTPCRSPAAPIHRRHSLVLAHGSELSSCHRHVVSLSVVPKRGC